MRQITRPRSAVLPVTFQAYLHTICGAFCEDNVCNACSVADKSDNGKERLQLDAFILISLVMVWFQRSLN